MTNITLTIKIIPYVHSIQHYVIKFVSDLRPQVNGFLRVLQFSPPSGVLKKPIHKYHPWWINHFIGCVSAKFLHSHRVSFTSVFQIPPPPSLHKILHLRQFDF